MNRGIRNELSKDDQQDLLKKLLHQQGKCLLIYPQGSHTTLLTALAETIHTNDETLHQKLSQRLDQDLKNETLPRRLGYIYDDPSIVGDFKKYPQLVNFVKIILEIFSASTERRINVYFLTYSGEIVYNLSCRVINQGGYFQEISIAKIDNKYYNIQDLELSSKNELSLDDVFKSSPHIDTQQLIETFKSESRFPGAEKKDKKDKFIAEETRSSGKPFEDLEELDLILKRAKSSVPFQQEEKPVFLNDASNRPETLSLSEEALLINECVGQTQQNFESYHSMGVMSQQQMYYLYYQNSYYPKNESYMSYPGVQMHSLSPSKANSFKPPGNGTTPNSPAYFNGNSNYSQNPVNSLVVEDGESKRYTGRLKFFDDAKNYGFIIMDSDDSDIFVHYDDLQKAGITKEVIKTFKNEMYMQIRFHFKVMEYFGKYKKSRKAVELVIIDDELSLLGTNYSPPE